MTDPEQGTRGITAFMIDTTEPGFERGKKEPKLGIRASATSEILFDDYACPVDNLLGEPGEGFKIAMTVLDAGRIGIAAQAVGIARGGARRVDRLCPGARVDGQEDRPVPDDPAEAGGHENPHSRRRGC